MTDNLDAFDHHAAGHFRSVFLPSTSAPARTEPTFLENLGMPGCPFCLANALRRAWCSDPKDARAWLPPLASTSPHWKGKLQ